MGTGQTFKTKMWCLTYRRDKKAEETSGGWLWRYKERKCMKTTTAIRVEIENCLNNHP